LRSAGRYDECPPPPEFADDSELPESCSRPEPEEDDSEDDGSDATPGVLGGRSGGGSGGLRLTPISRSMGGGGGRKGMPGGRPTDDPGERMIWAPA